MRAASLVIVACLGCGCSSTSDAAPDLCAGKPCLTHIDDGADWDQLADSVGERCDFDQGLKYLMPAVSTAAMSETVYQDVKVHRFHLEFMRAVFPEIFGGLPAETYADLVQRRATREYWAGSIFRVIDGNKVIGYGFDVIVDPAMPSEALTEAEISEIGAALRRTFALPLGYAPTQQSAIERAMGFADIGMPIHLPRVCPQPQCLDTSQNCFAAPQSVNICGVFVEGRSIQVEHSRLIQLEIPAGAWELPREAASDVAMTWFTGGSFGPARTPITADVPGSLDVIDNGAWLSYEYTQTLSAGTDSISVRWTLSAPADQSTQFTAEEPWLSTNAWISGTLNGSTSYDDTLNLSSCTYQSLDLFYGTGTLANGDSFKLHVRHQLPFAGSGPLNLVAADVTLGGTSLTVTDYFGLVYAGEHHNWNNQYWVLFDAPISYNGGMVHGIWVDEAAYSCCPLDGVWTLDAELKKRDPLTVQSYTFEPVE